MKKIISLLLALTLLVGCVATLSSCGEEDSGAQIAVYLGNEVYDLDPSDYFVSDNAAQFMSLLFEPLFFLDEDGDLEMAAAEDYEIDEEKREIRIMLRESYWSDGNRVVPNDFVFAWERLLNPANANPAAALLYDIEGALAVKTGEESSLYGASANNYGDGKTIVINYRENADVDALLANLASIATAPVRQSVVESAPGTWSKSASSIATNGAFKLASYDVESGEISLERNAGYRQPRDSKNFDKYVVPHKLVSFWSANETKLTLTYADIEAKTVFFLGDATAEARKDAALAEAAEAYDTLSTFTLAFLSEKEIFADVNVRKAMSLSLNRAAIAEALVFAKAATGFLPETVKGENGKAFAPSKTISTAQDASAALPAAAKGAKIKVALNNDTDSKIIGALVETAWEDLGLVVEISYLDAKVSTINDPSMGEISYSDSYVQYLVKTAAEGGSVEYDVVGFDWQMYSADPIVGLASLGSVMNGNGAVFGNQDSVSLRSSLGVWTPAKQAEYDQLLKVAYDAKDPATREAKLSAAAGLIAEDVPVIPVVFNQSFSVIGDDLSRVEVDYFGHFGFARAKQKNYEKYLPAEEN